MSEQEIAKLSEEERLLQEKLNEIRDKRIALEKMEQARLRISTDWDLALEENDWRTTGFPVYAQSFDSERQTVSVFTKQKDDRLVNIARTTPGRYYKGDGINTIPLDRWDEFCVRVEKLPPQPYPYRIVYSNGTKEAIEEFNKAPRLEISLSTDQKLLHLKPLKGEAWLARQFPGVRVKSTAGVVDYYTLGSSAITKVAEKLEKEDGIVWSDEAKAFLDEELTRRSALDAIALADDAEIDVSLNDITLRPFQRKGIKWLEANGYKGLLGDQMGLGKTPQAIAAIELLKKKFGKVRALVVCPANLKTNWVREIMRFTGDRPYVFSKSAPDKYDMEQLLKGAYTYHIINYDILGAKTEHHKESKTADGRTLLYDHKDRYVWAEMFNLMPFDIVIMDEVHYIKNVDSNRSRATRTLVSERFIGLTGTPVLNRPGELWAFLHMIAPNRFPTYEGFLYQYTYNGKEARNVGELRETLKTLMLRRTKKEVMKDLPPINRIYEWHDLSDTARVRYDAILRGVNVQLEEWNPEVRTQEDTQRIANILAQIMKMKQICAIDKVDTVADLAVNLSDADDNGGKVIIFSQFIPVVQAIRKRLGNEALEYTGQLAQGKARQDVIDEFVSSKEKKFLVATWQTAGEGLNLQCANNVIFADLFWTPANHQQSEERAYGRLADPHPINSYYVVVEGTIEGWIQELLDKKLAVIEQVVEGLDTERTKSIANELMLRMKMELRKGRR